MHTKLSFTLKLIFLQFYDINKGNSLMTIPCTTTYHCQKSTFPYKRQISVQSQRAFHCFETDEQREKPQKYVSHIIQLKTVPHVFNV